MPCARVERDDLRRPALAGGGAAVGGGGGGAVSADEAVGADVSGVSATAGELERDDARELRGERM